jgi:hypothetical protein
MSIQTKARDLMSRHHQMIKNREQSMLLRSLAELGLDIDMARYHSHIQGKTPNNFSTGYDRAHVTMS